MKASTGDVFYSSISPVQLDPVTPVNGLNDKTYRRGIARLIVRGHTGDPVGRPYWATIQKKTAEGRADDIIKTTGSSWMQLGHDRDT
ncbi:unnamed protein product [Pieris macdunnoughi]|uniref:Uncharacterized protein n=1 Tax=Pieris macdunnoughi TaxID=345717 RepID=A0A821SVR5_9NEOP|nr:unnamed protein product [Pieris macdunnoughi]